MTGQAGHPRLPSQRLRQLRARCDKFFGAPEVWPYIESAYEEPHRAYHNLNHLDELFSVLGPHLATAPHPEAIELAVWFHDYVYQVNLQDYGNNEALSADALAAVLAAVAPHWHSGSQKASLQLAQKFILSTKRHAVEDSSILTDSTSLRAAHLFLDADLAILASSPERFQAYDLEIAREWGQDPSAPSKPFCIGRAQAMKKFSERPTLYYSDEFVGLTDKARDNLEALVSKWERLAA